MAEKGSGKILCKANYRYLDGELCAGSNENENFAV
jgi:hypothetical protein